jgi:hypothetical protein
MMTVLVYPRKLVQLAGPLLAALTMLIQGFKLAAEHEAIDEMRSKVPYQEIVLVFSNVPHPEEKQTPRMRE